MTYPIRAEACLVFTDFIPELEEPDDLFLKSDINTVQLAQLRAGTLGQLDQSLHLEVQTFVHQIWRDVVKLTLHGKPQKYLQYFLS